MVDIGFLITLVVLASFVLGEVSLFLSIRWVNEKFRAKHPFPCMLYAACCAFSGFVWFWLLVCVAFGKLCDAGWHVS